MIFFDSLITALINILIVYRLLITFLTISQDYSTILLLRTNYRLNASKQNIHKLRHILKLFYYLLNENITFNKAQTSFSLESNE